MKERVIDFGRPGTRVRLRCVNGVTRHYDETTNNWYPVFVNTGREPERTTNNPDEVAEAYRDNVGHIGSVAIEEPDSDT